MKVIPLSKGARAYVDDEDYDRLITIGNWCLSSNGYAVHYRTRNGRRQTLQMHRIIMDAPRHLQVDHINRDKLDNRRENLRFATRSQNQANKGIQKNNSSRYKGVSKFRGKWAVRIRYNGKRFFLGNYDNPKLAAQVYDSAAIQLYDEFAGCNFPNQSIPKNIYKMVEIRLERQTA